MVRRFLILFLCFSFTSSPAMVFAQSFGQFRSRTTEQGGVEKRSFNKASESLLLEKSKKGVGTSEEGIVEGIGIKYQIHLLGQVGIPGTYRLSPSTRLSEAISKAGGISERGSVRQIELRRADRITRYDLLKFQRWGDLNQNPFLLDNDVIFVPYAENNISIQGPVKSNGIFELTPNNKSLWDLIQLAGGFTVGVSERDPITVVRFNSSEKQLIKVSNIKEELKRFELLNGDIVTIPHILMENRRFDYNVSELPADNMFFPTQKNDIFIAGAVSKAGPYEFNPTYSVRDYVIMAGPQELSTPKSAYVLTADGKYVKNPDRKRDFHLSPGDSIIVPKRSLTSDNVLKWYNTALSTALSVFAWQQVFK